MRILLRLAVVAALGLSVSACDKCGRWVFDTAPKSCSGDAPR